MSVLGNILLFSILCSVGAIAVAALFLFLPSRPREHVTTALVSFAVGALIGVALLELLPEALLQAPASTVFLAVALGIVVFFALEKVVILHHCHDDTCPVHQAQVPLILIGDGLHNFTDGLVIAAGFLVSAPVGISTGLAIMLHELFQEAGDLAILVSSGCTRRQAILFDILSGSTTIVGAVIAYAALTRVAWLLPYVLAVSSAGFLYIALADLVPLQHRRVHPAASIAQIVLQLAGMLSVLLFERLFGI